MFIVSLVLYSCKHTAAGDHNVDINRQHNSCHADHSVIAATVCIKDGIISVKNRTGFAAFLNLSFATTDACYAGRKCRAAAMPGPEFSLATRYEPQLLHEHRESEYSAIDNR